MPLPAARPQVCPDVCLALWAFCCFVTCLVGMSSFGLVTDGLLDTGCAVEVLVNNSADFVSELNGAVQSIGDGAVGIIDNVNTTISNTSDIAGGIEAVVAAVVAYTDWAKGLEARASVHVSLRSIRVTPRA